MTQAPPPLNLTGSRLACALSKLELTATKLTQQELSVRLGELIDLSGSLSIARAQLGPIGGDYEADNSIAGAAVSEFLRVQSALVQSVAGSFAPQPPTRNRLPAPPTEVPADQGKAGQAYQRFYAAMQREMEFKIQGLYEDTRRSLCRLSPELAQLCALDSSLRKTLAPLFRKAFGSMPQRVGLRFDQTCANYHLALAGQDHKQALWTQMMNRFGEELRSLLLAEIEARLLPVLGLIEAMNDEFNTLEEAEHL